MKLPLTAALVAALAACADPGPPVESAPPAPPQDSVVPASVGVLVDQDGRSVVVSAVRPGSRAEVLGVRAGDVVERLNGAPVASAREFYRRVLDAPPGSVVRLQLRRGEALQEVELPARQLDTMPRA